MTLGLGNLEKMPAVGKDAALLRFSLGNASLGAGKAAKTVPHLQKAVEHDLGYSAARKRLGRVLDEAGDAEAARTAHRKGIGIAKPGAISRPPGKGKCSPGASRKPSAYNPVIRQSFDPRSRT